MSSRAQRSGQSASDESTGAGDEDDHEAEPGTCLRG
jgi:hypothetical protein